MKLLRVLVFFLTVPVVYGEQPKPKTTHFALIHLFAEDGTTAEIQISGDRHTPIFLFRDPQGNRLRVERTGSDFPGQIIKYSLVSAGEPVSVETWSSQAFAAQNLPVPPMVRVGGSVIASVGDETRGVQGFSKSVSAEFKKLPVSFQAALLNFYRYGTQFGP